MCNFNKNIQRGSADIKRFVYETVSQWLNVIEEAEEVAFSILILVSYFDIISNIRTYVLILR